LFELQSDIFLLLLIEHLSVLVHGSSGFYCPFICRLSVLNVILGPHFCVKTRLNK